MTKTRLSAVNSATHPSTVKAYETGGKAAATRRRLLDAAAHVLAEKGFAGMRLSDVGEVAGVQAPAIYYHFSNKEDMLMALHLRLHEFGREALQQIGEQEPSKELWAALLDQVVDQLVANRKIFLLHERNQA